MTSLHLKSMNSKISTNLERSLHKIVSKLSNLKNILNVEIIAGGFFTSEASLQFPPVRSSVTKSCDQYYS